MRARSLPTCARHVSFLMSMRKRKQRHRVRLLRPQSHRQRPVAQRSARHAPSASRRCPTADFATLKDRVRRQVAAPIAEVDAHIAAAMPSAPMAHQEATSFADEY